MHVGELWEIFRRLFAGHRSAPSDKMPDAARLRLNKLSARQNIPVPNQQHAGVMGGPTDMPRAANRALAEPIGELDNLASSVIFAELLTERQGDLMVAFEGASANSSEIIASEMKERETVLVNEWDCKTDLVLTIDALLPDKNDDEQNTIEKFSEDSLKQLAASHGTPARILSWMASHVNPEIRALVSRNKSALPETIWLLAKDYDESVRLSIAEDLDASRAILKTLCDDPSPLVAWRAKNTLYLLKAGARTGSNFSKLPSPLITSGTQARPPDLAKNSSSTRGQADISDPNDKELDFLKVIAQKPSTPARRLAELARHPSQEIRALVAENANSPIETLWGLAKDFDGAVKLKLTENYNCPIEIIEALAGRQRLFRVLAGSQ